VKKIGDEYFTFMTDCDNPKACTVLLRGASRDVLNEMERNLHDAWSVARNIILEPNLLPGGGAAEMHLAQKMKVLRYKFMQCCCTELIFSCCAQEKNDLYQS